MTYVVAEPCIKCKYTECVSVCPVSCFREGVDCLVIDPNECIDCNACVDQCPAHAIYYERELPARWLEYKELNAKYAAIWPMIERSKAPLPTADELKNISPKGHLFDPRPFSGETPPQEP